MLSFEACWFSGYKFAFLKFRTYLVFYHPIFSNASWLQVLLHLLAMFSHFIETGTWTTLLCFRTTMGSVHLAQALLIAVAMLDTIRHVTVPLVIALTVPLIQWADIVIRARQITKEMEHCVTVHVSLAYCAYLLIDHSIDFYVRQKILFLSYWSHAPYPTIQHFSGFDLLCEVKFENWSDYMHARNMHKDAEANI